MTLTAIIILKIDLFHMLSFCLLYQVRFGGDIMQSLLIALDAAGKTPLYTQIYRHIQEEIATGRLEAGVRLPSKRALCALLGVSQSTVETAYGMLCDEGYLESRPKSGFYVRDLLPLSSLEAAHPAAAAHPRAQNAPRYDFSTGAVDTSRFPYATWAKINRETVYQCPHLLRQGDGQGEPGLRQTLSDFLYQHRGVRCTAGQIVIGAGAEYLTDLLLSLLEGAPTVALEDPGYPVVWHTAQRHGLPVCPIPVDGGGLSVAALTASPADIAFVTPSHQFPMGVTMPAGRRSRLLAWASSAPGRYIVEDDYDSEYRFTSRPIPALQGMDRGGRVVYLGTFSRGLAPAIRVAYMVLPSALLARYHSRKTFMASTVSRLEQETLRRFVEGGHYARHLRRMSTFYRTKQQALTAALRAIPGADISGDQAGLHFLLRLPGRDEKDLLARALAAGITLHGLSRYAHSLPGPDGTLVLGFAGLEPGRTAEAVSLLRQAWTV